MKVLWISLLPLNANRGGLIHVAAHPKGAPEPSKGGSLRICADNRKPFPPHAWLFSASREAPLWKTRGNHIEFLSPDWDLCGKYDGVSYRAWLSGVSLRQSREKTHIFNQRHISVLCKTASESYEAV